jgi:cation transporter-like permease
MIKYLRFILFVTFTAGLASTLCMVGGIGLEVVSDKLLPLVPLIIAVPGLNDTAGNYAAIIAAHAADPAERRLTRRKLARAIARVISINVTGMIALSLLIAVKRGYVLDVVFGIKFAAFVAIAICVVVAGIFGLTIILDKALEQHKLNPDDVLIPIVTALADVLMLSLIALGAFFLF